MSNLALVNGVILRLKDVEEVGVAEVEKLLADARTEVVHLESLLAELQKLAQPAAQPNAPVENAAPAEQTTPVEQPAPAAPAVPEQPAVPEVPAVDPNAAPVLQ